MPTIKIQLPLISWLFILLDISFLYFQFVRIYLRPAERRHWRAILLCLLSIVFTGVLGNLSALWVQVAVNVMVLSLIIYLLVKKVDSARITSGDAPLADEENVAFQMPEITEAMAAVFLENCRLFQFTAREIDVCLLLAKGMTYTEIGETLHIAVSTVDSHAQNSYKKAGVNSRVALLHKFYQKPGS